MAIYKCGSPAQYWRVGFRQVAAETVGNFSISEMGLYTSATSANLMAQAGATLTVDNIPGVYDVTGPLDATNNVVLDGAVLVDGNPNTTVDVTISDATTPAPWFVTLDLGAGVVDLPTEVSITVAAQHRTALDAWALHIERSDDGVTWTRIDTILLAAGPLQTEQRLRITGAGALRLRRWPVRGGNGFITGVVSEDAAPKPNARVVCMERDTLLPVSYATTDQYGSFAIYGLDTSRRYCLVAVDDTGAPLKQPVGWDHVEPTPGHRADNLIKQPYHNRCEIVGGQEVLGYYQFAEAQQQAIGVGMSELWWDFLYSDPLPSTWVRGGFTVPPSRAASAMAALRPDQPAIAHQSAAVDSNQVPLLKFRPADVSTSGFAVELVAGLRTATDTMCIVMLGETSLDKPRWRPDDAETTVSRGGLFFQYYVNYRTYSDPLIAEFTNTQVVLTYRLLGSGTTSSAYSTATVPFNAGIDLADGSLHHIVVTIGPNQDLTVYIDGVAQPSIGLTASGPLVNTGKHSTALYQELPATIQAALISDVFPTNSAVYMPLELTGTDLAVMAVYGRHLTAAEVTLLNDEARGVYPNTSVIAGLSGAEAAMVAKAPSLYMPMQDASVTTTLAQHMLPGPPVTFDAATDAGLDPYNQSNIPALVAGGQAGLAVVGPGTRSWFRVSPGNTARSAYMLGPGLVSPVQRTITAWVALPGTLASGESVAVEVWMMSGDDRFSTYPEVPRAARQLTSLVINLGSFGYRVNTASGTVQLSQDSVGYTVPQNTAVFLTVVLDYILGQSIFYANGSEVGRRTFASYMQYGQTGEVKVVNAATATDFLVRDFAIYDHVLTVAEIQELYAAGG